MEYIVSGVQPQGIDFGATGPQEILQNVRTIITTPRGSVPLDRGFGLELTYLDAPIPVAQARMSGQVNEALKRYEPRVEVVAINYTADEANGRLYPVVTIRIREEDAA